MELAMKYARAVRRHSGYLLHTKGGGWINLESLEIDLKLDEAITS